MAQINVLQMAVNEIGRVGEDRGRLQFAKTAAPMTRIPALFKEIGEKYGVAVERDIWNESLNTASCAGNRIMLGEFDNPGHEITAFFHELGHAMADQIFGPRTQFDKVFFEAMAWEIGHYYAEKEKIALDHEWAVKQWATYVPASIVDIIKTENAIEEPS